MSSYHEGEQKLRVAPSFVQWW